tara:strand:- start:17194 stop:18654 length:1461 start_codon:yes stop_codon:yes gene_type:complete
MEKSPPVKVLDKYNLVVNDITSVVAIEVLEEEPVPIYTVSLLNISKATKIMLDKVINQFISEKFESLMKFENQSPAEIIARFKTVIKQLLVKYFPNMSHKEMSMLINYVLQQNVGLGNIELLLKDSNLEEIVVNNSKDPVWVYHRLYGWLKTNVIMQTEGKIRQYATMIGRDSGKEITTLRPFLDAHLTTGDRVNSTLQPISSRGNTLTIRKFAVKPWTITDFIKTNTISYAGAALLWTAVQNEISMVIGGGTASGKTSMLNGIANFFPPNQRIISIEDTRELKLPKILHWVPMETRLANPEGKGEVSMLDLIVNSLRMRPDRIIVGEMRRRAEAEVLFEAMHTGHSVYGTLHANNSKEAVDRLTNPPINLPKTLISAIGLIVIQNLNRRLGKRRTFQIAEVQPNGDPKVLMQYDPKTDRLKYVNQPKIFFEAIELLTGMSKDDIIKDMSRKIAIMKVMVEKNVTNIHDIGLIMSKFYRGQSIGDV